MGKIKQFFGSFWSFLQLRKRTHTPLPFRFRKRFLITKKRIAIGIVSLLISGVGIWYLNDTYGAKAAWWDDSFQYRKPIVISNSGSAQTEYQVSFTLDTATLITAGKMQSDCDDIRITAQNGEKLPYWIEENNPGCNNASTLIWVKIPSIPTTNQTIYVYYGNATAIKGSDGSLVFPFFDDFNQASLDTAKWTDTGAESVSGGALTITTGAVYTDAPILPTAQGYIYEQRTKWTTTTGSYSGMMIADDQSTGGSNSQSDQLIYLMTDAAANYNITAWAADGTAASYNIIGGTTVYTASADTYHISAFSMDSSNVSFHNNRSLLVGYTGTWTQAPYLWLGYFSGTTASTTNIKDMTTDWILARKYASTAPSAGSPGTEEVTPAPIVYWKFDEGQGTTAYDSMGNSDTTLASGSSTPTWISESQCISGQCLWFDGTNDHVQTADAPVLDISGTSGLTQSVWVKLNSIPTSSSMPILMTTETGQGSGTFDKGFFVTTSGTAQFYVYDGATKFATSTTVLEVNKWYHLAGTYDGSTSSLYINGVLAATIGASSTYNFTSPQLVIGFRQGSYLQLKGFIDEVKIYPYARTATQIKQDYISRGSVNGVSAQFGDSDVGRKLSNGLVGYWKMDEVGVSGSSWTAVDSSGNNNNGTGAGNASVGTTQPGKFGNAGFFDGNGDQVVVPDSSSLDVGPKATWSVWIKLSSLPSVTGNTYRILDKYIGTGNQRSYTLSVTTTDKLHMIIDPAGTGSSEVDVASDDALSTGVWYHVVAIADGTNAYMYVNAVKQSDVESVTAIYSSTSGLYVGSDTSTLYFVGSIDDVRIYNRAFTPVEVGQLYNFSAGPVGHWKLDDGTGSSAADSSGVGNTGALGTGNSAPEWIKGKLGQALAFDGTSDQVQISGLMATPRSITVEAWVNQRIGERGGEVVSLGDSVVLRTSTTGISTFFHDGTTWRATSYNVGLTTSEWNHIAYMVDVGSTTQKIYFNGIGVTSSFYTGSVSYGLGQNTFIGKHGNGGSSFFDFKGLIDDVKVYNYARTPAQIVQDMNAGHPAPGSPVGSALVHYRLDEGYGTTINNAGNAGSTLNGTFGTGTSAPTWTNDGKFGKALSFDGTSDYVSISSFTAPESVTISLWLYESGLSNQNAGILYSSSPSDATADWGIRYNGTNTVRFFDTHAGTNNAVTIGTVTPGQWTHFAISINGTTATPYVNGVKGTETTLTQSHISRSLSNFRLGHLGNYSSVAYFLNGRVDDVKIYSFALTADQLKVEYNQGKSQVLGAGSSGIGGTGSSFSAGREYCVPGDSSTCNAPIGEWKFDEGSGSTANDTSGNGYSGALTSGPIWTNGKLGKALDFDGADDYVDLGDIAAIDSADDFSLCAWVKPATDSTDDYIFAKYNSGTDTGIQFLRDNVGSSSGRTDIFKIRIGQPGGNDAELETSSNSVIANQWTHVCVTFIEGSTTGLRVYVNGGEDAFSPATTALVTSIDASTFTATIGASNGGSFFDGDIDNVRLFDYVLSPAQVAWEYNQGQPIAHYRLDECQGTTAYNSAKNGNGKPAGINGTITIGGSGTQTSTGTCSSGSATEAWNNGTSGKRNASLNFDGTDDYVSLGNPDILDFPENTPISIAFWVNVNSFQSGIIGLVQKGQQSSLEPYYIRLSSGNLQVGSWDGTNHNAVWTPQGWNTSEWHHIVGLYDGTAWRAYFDGKEVASTVTDSGPEVNSRTVTIGARDNGTIDRFFNGKIDDVRFYNYPLTPVQIKTIMNEGAVSFR